MNSSFHISFLNDNSYSGRFLISRTEPKQIIVHYLVYFDILKEELSNLAYNVTHFWFHLRLDVASSTNTREIINF